MAFSHAAEGEAKALAWWRLHRLRQGRVALLGAEEAPRLPALPAPPEGALSVFQKLRLRLGWLDVAKAVPPARLARLLAAR